MKRQTLNISIRLIAAGSIIYTLCFYAQALLQIHNGQVQWQGHDYYPWLVALEGIVLLIAAAIPLLASWYPTILKRRSIRWLGGICIAYGILISINFFIHRHTSFTASHLKIGLRLASWCALAVLSYWTLKQQSKNPLQVEAR
jgi:hypothetical protein